MSTPEIDLDALEAEVRECSEWTATGRRVELYADVVRALLDRLERAEADLDETRFCLGVAASRDPGLIQAIREAPRD